MYQAGPPRAPARRRSLTWGSIRADVESYHGELVAGYVKDRLDGSPDGYVAADVALDVTGIGAGILRQHRLAASKKDNSDRNPGGDYE